MTQWCLKRKAQEARPVLDFLETSTHVQLLEVYLIELPSFIAQIKYG